MGHHILADAVARDDRCHHRLWLSQFPGRLRRRHRLEASTGPIFAECEDGLGGGNGNFKGLLSQVRYDIPLFSAGERFEIFGHVLAELFNPGDYYETDRPGWFLRWQIDVKF